MQSRPEADSTPILFKASPISNCVTGSDCCVWTSSWSRRLIALCVTKCSVIRSSEAVPPRRSQLLTANLCVYTVTVLHVCEWDRCTVAYLYARYAMPHVLSSPSFLTKYLQWFLFAVWMRDLYLFIFSLHSRFIVLNGSSLGLSTLMILDPRAFTAAV